MTSKAKLAGGLGIVSLGILAVVSAVSATTALSVSCTGTVSPGTTTSTITWIASSTGGNAPYALLWSGHPAVLGSTSTAILGTYTANGTYIANVQVTDASSSVATSTCQAQITSIVTPTATSTVNVFVSVNNAAGGSAVPSNVAITVGGANATPSSFAGSASGTSVTVNANSSFTVAASSLANYAQGTSGMCSGSLTAGAATSCTITETFVQPAPTSTPPAPPTPRVNPPSLAIESDGNFLARGMTVTGVGSTSFQAQVWGITYTVNWAGSLSPELEFFFRFLMSTSTPMKQLAVGDEVGVSGAIDPAAPFVVNANVVRDYSITAPRHHDDDEDRNGDNERGDHGNRGDDHRQNSFSVDDAQSRLKDLVKQLENLQNIFRSRGGDGGRHDDD